MLFAETPLLSQRRGYSDRGQVLNYQPQRRLVEFSRLSEGEQNTVESINFYFADPVAFSFFFFSASASFSFSMTSTNLSTSSGCSI